MTATTNTLASSDSLDPPGSIIIVGGGPLGIEAALYGRFLGYNITLLHPRSLDDFMVDERDNELPLLPDRSLSPLAVSALEAQNHELGPQSLPMTVDQWIQRGLQAICQSDLLRGRVRSGQTVTGIETIPVEPEEEVASESPNELDGDDFRVTIGQDSIMGEALILVSDQNEEFRRMLPPETAYCSIIPPFEIDEMETTLANGYRQIVKVYAQWMDREGLDLYRPVRGS